MRVTYLLAIGFVLFLTAGWHRLFPRFTPQPGSSAWDRAIVAFALVAFFTAQQQFRSDQLPEAGATLFLGLVVTGLAGYAGWRYQRLQASRGS